MLGNHPNIAIRIITLLSSVQFSKNIKGTTYTYYHHHWQQHGMYSLKTKQCKYREQPDANDLGLEKHISAFQISIERR